LDNAELYVVDVVVAKEAADAVRVTALNDVAVKLIVLAANDFAVNVLVNCPCTVAVVV
jgi:hypothetical protein